MQSISGKTPFSKMTANAIMHVVLYYKGDFFMVEFLFPKLETHAPPVNAS
jgi:hypothetical protein